MEVQKRRLFWKQQFHPLFAILFPFSSLLWSLHRAAALFVLTVLLALLFLASRGQTALIRFGPFQLVALPDLSQQVVNDAAFVLSRHTPSD